MANHKSSKKRIIRNEKKRLENKSRMSKIRTFVKKLSLAVIGNKDKAEVQTALSQANSQLAKGVKKGIVSKKKMLSFLIFLSVTPPHPTAMPQPSPQGEGKGKMKMTAFLGFPLRGSCHEHKHSALSD